MTDPNLADRMEEAAATVEEVARLYNYKIPEMAAFSAISLRKEAPVIRAMLEACPSVSMLGVECELPNQHDGSHVRGELEWTTEQVREEVAAYERRGGNWE